MNNQNFKRFVDSAAAHFEAGSVDAIPQDLPVNYYPVRFIPYLRQDAIVDAAMDAQMELQNISGVTILAFQALKFVIEDCEAKETYRKMAANRLNNPLH